MKNNLISVSIDDGHPLDIKAAEILAKKNIHTTFYIPIKNSTGRPTLNRRQIKWLSQNPNFEIGGHTYNHIDLTKISLKEAEEEIKSGKEALEDIIGKKVTSFAWPWGRYNENLIELVKKIGFLDCRSAILLSFNQVNKNNFLWHPNLYLYPKNLRNDIAFFIKRLNYLDLYKRIRYFRETHLGLIKIFTKLNSNVYFWFHSWEIEKYQLWSVIENF